MEPSPSRNSLRDKCLTYFPIPHAFRVLVPLTGKKRNHFEIAFLLQLGLEMPVIPGTGYQDFLTIPSLVSQASDSSFQVRSIFSVGTERRHSNPLKTVAASTQLKMAPLPFTDLLLDGMVLGFNGFVAADGFTYLANDWLFFI